MKVLITTDLYTTATNGVVTSVRNLSRELAEAGHEVKILTLSDTLHSHKEGDIYYLHSLPLKIYPDVRMPLPRSAHSQELLRELIAWKPDIIHSQCEFFSFHYARRIAKRTGAPLVHTYHTQYEQYVSYVMPGRRAGDFLVKTFSRVRLKKVDIIIAPTAKMKQVLEDYGVKNSIEIVPSGICLQQHQGRMTAPERDKMRQVLGIPKDHKVVLNLGRLGTEKNLDEVVALFALQLQRNPDLTLLIVGDGPAREKLCRQAQAGGCVRQRLHQRDPGPDLYRSRGQRPAPGLPGGPLPGWGHRPGRKRLHLYLPRRIPGRDGPGAGGPRLVRLRRAEKRGDRLPLRQGAVRPEHRGRLRSRHPGGGKRRITQSPCSTPRNRGFGLYLVAC